MGMRYNPPPNWPQPPAGWQPPPGWAPDPAWGPAPPGWQLWIAAPGFAGTPHAAPQNNGTAMVAVAAATCGLAGFVPPLWASRQRPEDAPFRRRMYLVAGALFGLMVVGVSLIALAEEDASGSPTGPLSDLAGAILLVNLVVAVTVAVLVRKTGADPLLPGVAEGLARRRLREQYRQLATSDPALAHSLGVGRPDLPRNLDDGGLLDLNAIPPDSLGSLAGLSADEVDRVVDARQRLGRFTSIDELAVYAELPDTTVVRLRECAVFL